MKHKIILIIFYILGILLIFNSLGDGMNAIRDYKDPLNISLTDLVSGTTNNHNKYILQGTLSFLIVFIIISSIFVGKKKEWRLKLVVILAASIIICNIIYIFSLDPVARPYYKGTLIAHIIFSILLFIEYNLYNKIKNEKDYNNIDTNHNEQVMKLATLPVNALEGLKQNPGTYIITMPDGIQLNFNESQLNDAFNAAKLMEKGDLYSQNKNYTKAEELYKESLKLNPIDPILIMSRGNVLCLLGKIDEGIAELKKAVDLCPIDYREKARVLNNYYGAKEHFGK